MSQPARLYPILHHPLRKKFRQLAFLGSLGKWMDVALGRSVYLQLSTYRESGTASASIQSYGSFSWRF